MRLEIGCPGWSARFVQAGSGTVSKAGEDGMSYCDGDEPSADGYHDFAVYFMACAFAAVLAIGLVLLRTVS